MSEYKALINRFRRCIFAAGVLIFSSLASAEFSIDEVELRAQLSPVRFTTLSAEFGAQISQMALSEGERVKKGDRLVAFDCSLHRAQLSKARATLAGAQNLYKGNQKLAKLGAIGQVELKSAEVEVQKARADIGYLKAILSKCEVSAPFDGRIGLISAQAGQFVQPGQALIEIFDDSLLELAFIVPSRWMPWFTVGSAFEVLIEDTGKTYPARLVRTSGRADPVSQSVRAFAQIDGTHTGLLAGMSGKLIIRPPE